MCSSGMDNIQIQVWRDQKFRAGGEGSFGKGDIGDGAGAKKCVCRNAARGAISGVPQHLLYPL